MSERAAQRIKELEAEVGRQTTECIKRGFEVERLMTELSSLKLMVESYRVKLAVYEEQTGIASSMLNPDSDPGMALNQIFTRLSTEALQALGEKE